MVDIDYTEIPKSCDTCPHAIENIEEQYDRTGVWYECKLVDGGCNPGERLKDCPLNKDLVKESGVLVKDLVKEGDLISRKEVLKEGAYYSNRPTHTFLKVVKELPAYSAEQTYDWCKGCKEYDTEKHCCHRYSSFIRESLQENINAVLDGIKAELQTLADDEWNQKVMADKGLELAIEIIENYISRKE